MGKRRNQITINLTDEERELIERLSEIYERKPAELVRILATRKGLEVWGSMQPKGEELTPLKF